MRKLLPLFLLIFITLSFTGCVNKHGISAKYYSDCDEYYDMQGYYHKECGKDDIVTYKQIGDTTKKVVKKVVNKVNGIEEQPDTRNVW